MTTTEMAMDTAGPAFVSLPPTKLLRLAIRKRKALLAEKDTDMRKKLLLSATIHSLCRHIGAARAARRRDAANAANAALSGSSLSNAALSGSSLSNASLSEAARSSSPLRKRSASRCPSPPPEEKEQKRPRTQTKPVQTSPPPSPPLETEPVESSRHSSQPSSGPVKRPLQDEDDDPFGLDAFFSSLKAVKLR